MKQFVENHRHDISFKVGEWVIVKLRPHQQTLVKGKPHSKLAKRFYGPYQILEKIGHMAYKLKLPDNSCIHHVFHCSHLKHCLHPLKVVINGSELAHTAINDYPIISPLVILNSKWEHSEQEPQLMVLVQWKGLSPDDTSWENWNKLKVVITLRTRCYLMWVGML